MSIINSTIIRRLTEICYYNTSPNIFNFSTSTGALILSGVGTFKNLIRAIYTPNPVCKGLLVTSSALNGVSMISNAVTLHYGKSCNTVAMVSLALGYIANRGAKACNNASNSIDPIPF